MTLEELQEIADKDLKINDSELDLESIKTPQIHNKYMKHLTKFKLMLSKAEAEYNIVKKQKWELSDLRWLISPLILIFLTIILPWWKYNTSQHTDAYYHVLEARNFAGFVDWTPSHQGLDFLFRPPIVPGSYTIELSLNGLTWVTFTPLILTIATLWQLQHLSELWTTKSNSCLVIKHRYAVPFSIIEATTD